MNKLLIYSILHIFIVASLANNITDGHIYDSDSRPVYNAEVYIESLSKGSSTDSSGYFRIVIPSSFTDKDSITISHIGYETKKINISNKTVQVYLQEKILDVNQIVVTALGYKSYVKDTPVITHVITGEEIYQSPNNSIRDIIEFVIPNVQRIHDPHGNDRVKIQGLDNKFVVFMIDGNRVSGEFAGNIDLSMLSISDIERIEVIRSGMSTLYGSDSMGGLINIITKKSNKPITFNASYTYDLPTSQSLSANLGAKFFSNLTFKVNIDYNSSEGYDLTEYSPLSKTLEENLNYNIKNSISYKNESLSINYINRNYVKHVSKYSEFVHPETMLDSTPLSGKNPRYSDVMNALSLDYKMNSDFNIKFKFLNEIYNKSFYFPYYYNESSFDRSINGEEIVSASPERSDYSLILNTNFKDNFLSLGFEYAKENYQSFNIYSADGLAIEEPSIFESEDEKNINEYSVFLIDKLECLNNELVFGLRLTKHNGSDWNFIPSFSLRRNMHGYNIRLNYSKGYRIPSLKELYYSYEDHDPSIYGDPSLRPSLSNYYAISLESRELKNSSVEFYFNNVLDMISPIYRSDGMYYSNNKEISLYGFNINLQKKVFDRVDFSAVYSYTDGISSDMTMVEGISNHTVNARFKYNISNQINILLTNKYHSSKDVFVYDTGESQSLDAYNISDILLSFKYKKILIKGGVKNILDYLDKGRLNASSNEFLTSTDPGRRIYFNIMFSI